MFVYKPGDIIIRNKKFYEPRHMMIVVQVRPKLHEMIVSHLTYGGLQLFTFHREDASLSLDPNQKVIRWKGSKKVIKRLLSFISELHENYRIEYSRLATIKSLVKKCYNPHPKKVNIKEFEHAELYCSTYITLVWKYILDEFNIDDSAFPLNPYDCYSEELFDVLSNIPTYWDVFYLKTSKLGRVGPIENNFRKKSRNH